jgi:hypothetical protein
MELLPQENKNSFSNNLQNEELYSLKEDEEFASFWVRLLSFISAIGLTFYIVVVLSILFALYYQPHFLYFSAKDSPLFSFLDSYIELVIVVGLLSTFFLLRSVSHYIFGLTAVDIYGKKISCIKTVQKFFLDIISFFRFGFIQIFKTETRQSWADKKMNIFIVHSKKRNIFTSIGIIIVITGSIFLYSQNFNRFGMITHSFIFQGAYKNGFYSIKMPLVANESEWSSLRLTLPFQNSSTTVLIDRAMSYDKKTGYFVYTYLFPETSITTENSKDILNSVFEQDVVVNHGILVSTSTNNFNSRVPGLSFSYSYQSENNTYISKGSYIVLGYSTIARLDVVCKKDDCDEEKANTFFTSFKLNSQ